MSTKTTKILVVDDEPDILEFIQYNLEKEGYSVFVAKDGHEAIKTAKKELPHLILLDIMMPELDGIETCKRLRNLGFNNTIIAFLTARNEDYSEIAGFKVGADDYITKPIKPKVLMSRIKALLRRHQEEDKTIITQVGNIKIDKEKYIVSQNSKQFTLPKKEFELLVLLTSKPGKVFKRAEILNIIWGNDIYVGERTIDVHIRKLREKIGENHIKTLKGIGYKFDQ